VPKLLSISLGRRSHPTIRSSAFSECGKVPVAAGCSDHLCPCQGLPRSTGSGKSFYSSKANESHHERLSQEAEECAPANRSRGRPAVAPKAIDPTAKRPTAKCDPYGQGGKPMDAAQAKMLLSTVHGDWSIVSKSVSGIGAGQSGPTSSALHHDGDSDTRELQRIEGSAADGTDLGGDGASLYLVRQFGHPDFGSAGRFAAVVAAVADLQAHYPRQVVVERRIVKKNWVVSTTIVCHTQVLKGLSINDFHLAMVRELRKRGDTCVRTPEARRIVPVRSRDLICLHSLSLKRGSLTLDFLLCFSVQMIDVEVDRPEVRKLLGLVQ
jgi:pterin-4a-carbinolamine dehydratase